MTILSFMTRLVLFLPTNFTIYNLTLHYFTSVPEIDIRLRPMSDQNLVANWGRV
jgi:hypothetical protein